mgnify:CR=1 FL=1
MSADGRTDTLLLTQRNVYILPTRGGMLFCFTLGVLLIASINYQLNLGYLLTFLLAGSAVVGMHVCHATLRGLTMNLMQPDPQFAGASAMLTVEVSGGRILLPGAKTDARTRFYLFVLKGYAYLSLRLDDPIEARDHEGNW